MDLAADLALSGLGFWAADLISMADFSLSGLGLKWTWIDGGLGLMVGAALCSRNFKRVWNSCSSSCSAALVVGGLGWMVDLAGISLLHFLLLLIFRCSFYTVFI